MRLLRFALPLLLFLVLLILLARGLTLDPRKLPSPLIGKPAPAFAVPRLDDAAGQLRPADMAGRVWLLNVWASWCAPCLEEHPALMALAQRGVVPIVGLNHKDTREAGRAWLQRHGNPYHASGFDGDGRTGIDFGVYGVPETYVIDRAGIVRFKHTGPLTRDVIEARIEPLLKKLEQAGG
ncbi:MAG: DsbE family thiol:disulfide interchange protein [Pseudomonadota bacterium]